MTSAGSVGGDGSLRLFLALRLPDDVLDELVRWSGRELRTCRRLSRDQLHITLAFLGRRPEADLPGILRALDEAAAASERFSLRPLRWRETASAGMVVLEDRSGRAGALAGALQDRLEQLAVYRRENRAWLPHVTVARFRSRPRLDPPLPPVRTFVPSDAAAYLSELHPSGARYEVLHSAPLGRAGTGKQAKRDGSSATTAS